MASQAVVAGTCPPKSTLCDRSHLAGGSTTNPKDLRPVQLQQTGACAVNLYVHWGSRSKRGGCRPTLVFPSPQDLTEHYLVRSVD